MPTVRISEEMHKKLVKLAALEGLIKEQVVTVNDALWIIQKHIDREITSRETKVIQNATAKKE